MAAANTTSLITDGRTATTGEMILGGGLGGIAGLIGSTGITSKAFDAIRSFNQGSFDYGMSAGSAGGNNYVPSSQ